MFERRDPSDRAVSAWLYGGKGKATPKNRVLLRFHTASPNCCPTRATVVVKVYSMPAIGRRDVHASAHVGRRRINPLTQVPIRGQGNRHSRSPRFEWQKSNLKLPYGRRYLDVGSGRTTPIGYRAAFWCGPAIRVTVSRDARAAATGRIRADGERTKLTLPGRPAPAHCSSSAE
jgi:hypothetical protein